MNSASLCSLAGRYNNPIPPRCLAPIDFLKIPAQFLFLCRQMFDSAHYYTALRPLLVNTSVQNFFVYCIVRAIARSRYLRIAACYIVNRKVYSYILNPEYYRSRRINIFSRRILVRTVSMWYLCYITRKDWSVTSYARLGFVSHPARYTLTMGNYVLH